MTLLSFSNDTIVPPNVFQERTTQQPHENTNILRNVIVANPSDSQLRPSIQGVENVTTFMRLFQYEEEKTNTEAQYLNRKEYEVINLVSLRNNLNGPFYRNNRELHHLFAILDENASVFNEVKDGNKVSQFFKISLMKMKSCFRHKKIQRITECIYHYLNILSLAVRPLDSGASRVNLLNDIRKLDHLKNIFNRQLKNFCESFNIYIKNEQKTEKCLEDLLLAHTNLINLKSKIDRHAQENRNAYNKYLLDFTKQVASNLALLVSYSPFKIFIEMALIVGKIPCLEILDCILVSFNLRQIVENKLSQQEYQEVIELQENKSTTHVSHLNKKLFNNFSRLLDQKTKDWNELVVSFGDALAKLNEETALLVDNKEISLEDPTSLKLKKIKRLYHSPSEIPTIVKRHFLKMKSNMSEVDVEKWMKTRSCFFLLNRFLDEQAETQYHLTKSASALINNKLKIEKIFLDYNFTQAKFLKIYSFSALAITLLGTLVSISIGAISIIPTALVALAIASIVLTLSFWIARYFINKKYRSHSAGFFMNSKISYHQIKYEANNYWFNIFMNSINSKNPNASEQIRKNIPIDLIANIEVAERDKFKKMEQKNKILFSILEEKKAIKRKEEWKDVEKFANLPSYFLRNFVERLEKLDLSLLNSDEKMVRILNLGLGLNVTKLIDMFKSTVKEKREFARTILMKDLETLFTLKNEEYAFFLKFQLNNNEKVKAKKTDQIVTLKI